MGPQNSPEVLTARQDDGRKYGLINDARLHFQSIPRPHHQSRDLKTITFWVIKEKVKWVD